MRPDVRKQIVILGTLIAAVAAPTGFIHAGDDPRELPPEVIDSNRDYFAVLYRQTFGADAAGTTFASCRSTDPFIGLYDFYLLKPHSPAAPVLLHFDRDRFVIENYGTVRYFEGQVEVWAARGGERHVRKTTDRGRTAGSGGIPARRRCRRRFYDRAP